MPPVPVINPPIKTTLAEVAKATTIKDFTLPMSTKSDIVFPNTLSDFVFWGYNKRVGTTNLSSFLKPPAAMKIKKDSAL